MMYVNLDSLQRTPNDTELIKISLTPGTKAAGVPVQLSHIKLSIQTAISCGLIQYHKPTQHYQQPILPSKKESPGSCSAKIFVLKYTHGLLVRMFTEKYKAYLHTLLSACVFCLINSNQKMKVNIAAEVLWAPPKWFNPREQHWGTNNSSGIPTVPGSEQTESQMQINISILSTVKNMRPP